MNPFSLERKFQSLHDQQIVQFKCDKCMSQNFYKSLCHKEMFCTLLDFNYANVEQILIPYLSNLEIFNELSSDFLKYKQIYKQISMSVVRYLESILSHVFNVVWTFGRISFVILNNGLIRKLANRNLLLLQPKKQKKKMTWRKIQTTIICRRNAP